MISTRSVLCLLVLGLGDLTALAREYEGSRKDSILLNGRWEYARDGGDGAASVPRQEELAWQEVKLGGLLKHFERRAA